MSGSLNPATFSYQSRLQAADTLVASDFNIDPQKIGMVKLTDGCYTLSTEKKFLFKAKKKRSGQLVWGATAPITAEHVRKIVDLALRFNQSVHINTGTHGDSKGHTILTKRGLAEIQFAKEDMSYIWGKHNVSSHIVSSYSGPIYPEKANQVIDAWCFSQNSNNKAKEVKSGLYLTGRCTKCRSSKEIKIGDYGVFNIIQQKSRLGDKTLCSSRCPDSTIEFETMMVHNAKHTVDYLKQGNLANTVVNVNDIKEQVSYPLNEFYQYYQIEI
ncbi:MAG: hypothetical protein ACM3JI_00380 [Anaerolineae bacterium]